MTNTIVFFLLIMMLACVYRSKAFVMGRNSRISSRALDGRWASSKKTSSIKVKSEEKTAVKAVSRYSYDSLPEETIYIVDGTAWLYQTYHSPGRTGLSRASLFTDDLQERIKTKFPKESDTILNTTSFDSPCAALIEASQSFVDFIGKVRPRYLAVVFDAGKKTFRNELYDEYKLCRAQTPVELFPLFHLMPRALRALGAPIFMLPGYEADDIMATLGHWAKNRGLNAVLVSDDNDMLQLIEPGIHVMSRKRLQLIGEDDVIAKYGVAPSKLCDLRSLVGDKSDNIPGIKGIGLKSAAALINYFGTVDALLKTIQSAPTTMNQEKNVFASGSIPLPDPVDNISAKSTIKNPAAKWSPADMRDAVANSNTANIDFILSEALRGVRISRDKIISSLMAPETKKNIELYKQLLTLQRNVPLPGVHVPLPNSQSKQSLESVHIHTKNLEDAAMGLGKVSVSEEVFRIRKENEHFERYTNYLFAHDTIPLSDPTSSVADSNLSVQNPVDALHDKEKFLVTTDFRYRGESNDAEKELQAISDSFNIVLNSLRQFYRLIDRHD